MQIEEKYMNSKSSKSNENKQQQKQGQQKQREGKTSTVYFFRCPPQEDSPAWIKYFIVIASWDKALFLANIEIFQVAG